MKPMQVYLEEDSKEELGVLAKKLGVTMADLIREGIKAILEESRFSAQRKMIDDLAGLWEGREDMRDAESYVRKLRQTSRPKMDSVQEPSAKYVPFKKKPRR